MCMYTYTIDYIYLFIYKIGHVVHDCLIKNKSKEPQKFKQIKD